MMISRKQVFFFLYDDFIDWEISYAMHVVDNSHHLVLKTIAIDKNIKRSASGLSIVPDLDFMPSVDLKDIDLSNTALLVLPDAMLWNDAVIQKIIPLIQHCVDEGIMVVALGKWYALLSPLRLDKERGLLLYNQAPDFPDGPSLILKVLKSGITQNHPMLYVSMFE